MNPTKSDLSLNRRILALALPAIVNNITVPLLGLCDTAIAGHLGSAAYLGAMAVGAMMLNVVYWLCGFLRMGTTALSAQAYGASDFSRVRDIIRKAFLIGAVISVVVIIARSPLERMLLQVIGADQTVALNASLYFRILVWAVPAQLTVMSVSGWFIGLQNTTVPMVIAVGINIVNIFVSLTLVFGFGLGFTGIAVGTLAANWIGFAGALIFVCGRMKKMPNPSTRSVVKWGRFFSVNTDLFLRSACIMCVTLAMTSIGSRLGETTLAANAVIMQFFLFFSYFMDGYAFAGEAIEGSAAGANDYDAVRNGVRALCVWGAAMALLFFLVYLCASDAVASLLTDVSEVRETVRGLRFWIVILPPVTVAAFIFDGIFIGLARTRRLLVTTLIAAAAFFVIVFLVPGAGILPSDNLLWLAFETYLLLRGTLLALGYVKLQRF